MLLALIARFAVLGLPNLIFSPSSGKLRAYLNHLTKLLYQGPNSNFPGPTSGSTACVAVIRNDQLIVANAGDSRCVISRKGQVC